MEQVMCWKKNVEARWKKSYDRTEPPREKGEEELWLYTDESIKAELSLRGV